MPLVVSITAYVALLVFEPINLQRARQQDSVIDLSTLSHHFRYLPGFCGLSYDQEDSSRSPHCHIDLDWRSPRRQWYPIITADMVVQFTCKQCGKQVLDRSALEHHHSMVHEEMGLCSFAACRDVFVSNAERERHTNEMHPKCPFEDCSYRLNTCQEMRDHIKETHPSLVLCRFDECWFTTRVRNEMAKHDRLGHQGGQGYCPWVLLKGRPGCPAIVYSGQVDLEAHIEQVHAGQWHDPKLHILEGLYGYQENSAYRSGVHSSTAMLSPQDRPKRTTTEDPGHGFNLQPGKLTNQKIVCQLCGHKWADDTASNFRIHMNTSHGRPHSCEYGCLKSWTSKAALDDHHRVAHLIGVKLPCKERNCNFFTEDGPNTYNQHYLTEHGVTMGPIYPEYTWFSLP